MDVIKFAEELQREAVALLNDQALWQPFFQKGKIHVAGSAYLDLLVFADLDVYFEADETEDLIGIFADSARNLIRIDKVTSKDFLSCNLLS